MAYQHLLYELRLPGDEFDTMLKILKMNRKDRPQRKDQFVRI